MCPRTCPGRVLVGGRRRRAVASPGRRGACGGGGVCRRGVPLAEAALSPLPSFLTPASSRLSSFTPALFTPALFTPSLLHICPLHTLSSSHLPSSQPPLSPACRRGGGAPAPRLSDGVGGRVPRGGVPRPQRPGVRGDGPLFWTSLSSTNRAAHPQCLPSLDGPHAGRLRAPPPHRQGRVREGLPGPLRPQRRGVRDEGRGQGVRREVPLDGQPPDEWTAYSPDCLN